MDGSAQYGSRILQLRSLVMKPRGYTTTTFNQGGGKAFRSTRNLKNLNMSKPESTNRSLW